MLFSDRIYYALRHVITSYIVWHKKGGTNVLSITFLALYWCTVQRVHNRDTPICMQIKCTYLGMCKQFMFVYMKYGVNHGLYGIQ